MSALTGLGWLMMKGMPRSIAASIANVHIDSRRTSLGRTSSKTLSTRRYNSRT